MIPSVWSFALLALAAFRSWKLIGDDAILDWPREWALDKIERWPEWWRRTEYFVTCPWCAGAWLALVWWGAWAIWPHWAVVVAVPFAISAAVGYLGVIIDSLESD